MERTLVLIKPDAMARGIAADVVQALEETLGHGTHIRLGSRQVVATPERASAHLSHLLERQSVYTRNYNLYVHQEVLVLIYTGESIINRVRAAVGATDPARSAPDTIRARFSTDSIAAAEREQRGLHNVIHASDSTESAEREIAIWLPEMATPPLLPDEGGTCVV